MKFMDTRNMINNIPQAEHVCTYQVGACHPVREFDGFGLLTTTAVRLYS
eukprot:SAG31_NODE_38346_length_297_cov_0.474747_1_plen_48_part_01